MIEVLRKCSQKIFQRCHLQESFNNYFAIQITFMDYMLIQQNITNSRRLFVSTQSSTTSLQLSTVTARPFSISDFSLGAGGTFPTQALILLPATVTVQVPHCPFLQSVGTFKPNFKHAAMRLDPGSASNRFPFATYTSTNMTT